MTDVFGASSGSTPIEKAFGFAKRHGKLLAKAAALKTAMTVIDAAQVGVGLIGEGVGNAQEAVSSLRSDQTMPQQESPAVTHAKVLAQFQQGQQHTIKMQGVRKVNK